MGAGGVLPPDVDAWAKQEGMKGVKLQALRNHQKVKKWTKASGGGGGVRALPCCAGVQLLLILCGGGHASVMVCVSLPRRAGWKCRSKVSCRLGSAADQPVDMHWQNAACCEA